MSQAVILVWLPATMLPPATMSGGVADAVGDVPTSEPAPPDASAPSASQRALLRGWAEHRLLSLEAPRANPRGPHGGYPSDLVRRIEDLLEQARTLSGSLDEERALDQLAQAERLIYDHPELPQAAFLLAEAASQQAEVSERTGQPRLAAVQRLRAEVIEGKRAETYTANAPPESDATSSVARMIQVHGLARADVLEWNGARQPSAKAMAAPGEHHVRVLRFGDNVWSGFVTVPLTGESIGLDVPPPEPCTRADLAMVSVRGQQIVGSEGVRCAQWIAARPAERGAIEVALCHGERCGKLRLWQAGDGALLTAPLHPDPGWRWPVWATYLTIGIGVAATTGAVLWQSGAFDEPERGPVTWTFGGIED